jgi:hypothetical protein
MAIQDIIAAFKPKLPRLKRGHRASADRLKIDPATAIEPDFKPADLSDEAFELQSTDSQPMAPPPVPEAKPRTGFGHSLKSKLSKLGQRKPKGSSGQAAGAEQDDVLAAPTSQLVKVDKHHYVFGLDWRFFTDNKDLHRTTRAAKREGFSHRVITQTEDLVGIARLSAVSKKFKLHSASLQVAQTVSMGGIELFVFKFDSDQYGLVALNDSRPIIGFEKAGSRSEIMTLAGEFQLSQVGYNIRQAGNTGSLEHEEPLKLSAAFAQPDDTTQVKPIPDYKMMALKGAAVLGVLAVMFSVYGYFNEAKIKEAMRKQVSERDPNFIYEREIGAGMKGTGLPAQVQMERWRNTIKDIPLSRQGWTLTTISCQPEKCTLNWKRDFGSYAEFFAVSQAHETLSTESQSPNNPAVSNIQTLLKVPPASARSAELTRDTLHSLAQMQRLLGSQLQDLSLLQNSKVELKAPELFPAPAGLTAQQVSKPVVRGEWMLAHEIWSLNDLQFNIPALELESLQISPADTSSEWFYTLKGRYYAKGKDF